MQTSLFRSSSKQSNLGHNSIQLPNVSLKFPAILFLLYNSYYCPPTIGLKCYASQKCEMYFSAPSAISNLTQRTQSKDFTKYPWLYHISLYSILWKRKMIKMSQSKKVVGISCRLCMFSCPYTALICVASTYSAVQYNSYWPWQLSHRLLDFMSLEVSVFRGKMCRICVVLFAGGNEVEPKLHFQQHYFTDDSHRRPVTNFNLLIVRIN